MEYFVWLHFIHFIATFCRKFVKVLLWVVVSWCNFTSTVVHISISYTHKIFRKTIQFVAHDRLQICVSEHYRDRSPLPHITALQWKKSHPFLEMFSLLCHWNTGTALFKLNDGWTGWNARVTWKLPLKINYFFSFSHEINILEMGVFHWTATISEWVFYSED